MAIEWSIPELQKHLDEIVSGERFFDVEHEDTLRCFLFRYPDKKGMQLSEVQQARAAFKARKGNIKTEEEMLQVIKDRKIWTEEDDEAVAEIKEKIDKWKAKLVDPDVKGTAKDYAAQLIEKLENDSWAIEVKKERMLVHTVERKSRQEKYNYLLWYCTTDLDTGERLSKDYLTLSDLIEERLRNDLLSEFLKFLAGHSTEEVRYLARNNLWRVNYVSATKANMPLFPRAVTELTPDQLNLIWWSSYYQSIYELLPEDQPEDWVIEDDELLDKHMAELHKERTKDNQSRRSERKFGTSTAMKMKEALVFRSHPDYQRLQYDAVPEGGNPNQVNKDLRDDPNMKGAQHKKTKGIARSRRYVPQKKSEE